MIVMTPIVLGIWGTFTIFIPKMSFPRRLSRRITAARAVRTKLGTLGTRNPRNLYNDMWEDVLKGGLGGFPPQEKTWDTS